MRVMRNGWTGLLPALVLGLVIVASGLPSSGSADPPGLVRGPDGDLGHWDELGEDGRIWVPMEPPAQTDLPGPDLGAYHNHEEMTEVLLELALERPGLFTLLPVGQTVEGRPIWMMRVTAPGSFASGTMVLLDGAHHGNEVIGSETLIRFLLEVHERYDEDPGVQEILSEVVVDVVPMVNADSVDRIPQCTNYAMCRKNSNGVDLNRNYPDHWGGPGSSSNPGSAVYHGPAPLSEPESQAVARLLDLHDYTLHATFHSGVEMILWPYGWTTSPPPDQEIYQELGQELSDATGGVRHGQTSHILYRASGTTMDQAYGSSQGLSQPLSFTPEAYRGGWGTAFDWFTLYNPPETEPEVAEVVGKWLPFVWHLADVAPEYGGSPLGVPVGLELPVGPGQGG